MSYQLNCTSLLMFKVIISNLGEESSYYVLSTKLRFIVNTNRLIYLVNFFFQKKGFSSNLLKFTFTKNSVFNFLYVYARTKFYIFVSLELDKPGQPIMQASRNIPSAIWWLYIILILKFGHFLISFV